MTLATVSFALKGPSDRFPNGYGKIESLGSLGVSSLLLVGGLLMGQLLGSVAEGFRLISRLVRLPCSGRFIRRVLPDPRGGRGARCPRSRS